MNDFYDVVVAGGGMAGVAATVAAARSGARTLLIEQGTMLGGMGTAGGVTHMIARTSNFGGIGRELMERLAETGGAEPFKPADIPYDLERMKLALDELVCESGAELLLYAKVIGVARDGNKITGLECCGQEGKFEVRGRCFVDCTGDAMLAHLAGEPCVVGDDEGRTQAPTLACHFVNVDWDAYRAFLKNYGDNTVAMIHDVLPRAVAAGDVRVADFHHPGVFRVNDTLTLVNVGHVYGADCLSPAGLTAATLEGRRLAHEYLRFYQKYIPGFANAYLAFTASTLGIRETRRIVGQYTATFEDKSAYRKFDDAILRYEGGGESDLHASSPSKEDYQKYFKLFTVQCDHRDDWADLPYRCLLPQKNKNLLVAGRCISTDRKVQGRLRVMGYCLMMGQAAGTAAAMCARENVACENADIPALQTALAKAGIPTKS